LSYYLSQGIAVAKKKVRKSDEGISLTAIRTPIENSTGEKGGAQDSITDIL